jgi:hypothetical protein
LLALEVDCLRAAAPHADNDAVLDKRRTDPGDTPVDDLEFTAARSVGLMPQDDTDGLDPERWAIGERHGGTGRGRYWGRRSPWCSFFEAVVRDHSKNHPVTATYVVATLTDCSYTTLLDSTWAQGPAPRWSHAPNIPTNVQWL